VSKGLKREVERLLQTLRLTWHGIIESTIFINRIASPCPTFLDICFRSRFVFEQGPESVLWFLKNIPNCMKPCIRDIVITRACLTGRGRSAIDNWDQYAGKNRCCFTQVLQGRCTSLKTIAVEVPSVITGGQYVNQSATGCILQLLHDEVISSAYFLQRQTSSENPHDRVIFDKMDELSSPLNTTAAPQSEGNATTEAVPRVFDVLEESGGTLTEWNHLGFERALKITRFTDTQLGTPTYTRLVGRT
jgi:hypothetical protein